MLDDFSRQAVIQRKMRAATIKHIMDSTALVLMKRVRIVSLCRQNKKKKSIIGPTHLLSLTSLHIQVALKWGLDESLILLTVCLETQTVTVFP